MFYQNFCRLCAAEQRSPSAVAQALGISKAAVSHWKSGRNAPQLQQVQKIAEHFGVTTDTLLADTPAGTDAEAADPLEEADIAFYGRYQKLDEEEKSALRDYLELMELRRARREQQK